MKRIATVAAAAALLTLTACDRLGMGGGSASTNTTNATASSNSAAGNSSASAEGPKPADGAAAAPAGATQARSGSTTLDRAFMMGRWTDDGDCSNSVNFASDGSFTAANGTGGLWRLSGDQLTMTGSSTLTLQIEPIDQNTMTVINPDGSLGRSTRC